MFDRIAHAFNLNDFGRRHKVGFVLLSFCIIAVIVLWIMQLQRSIVSPLYKNMDTSAQPIAAGTSSEESTLRAKDTDSDALSDWDELNLYKTSPYLADSDSDGFADKQEIDSGNNPNCPEGKSCAVSEVQPQTESSDFTNPGLDDLLSRTTASGGISPTVTPSASPSNSVLTAEEKQALRSALGESADPNSLRLLLLQAGMKQAQLDAMSDEQLVAAFNELIR